VVFGSALSAFALELDRPGRAAEVVRGLLRAEERIQQASTIELGHRHLVLQALPQISAVLATRTPSLRRVDGGDQEQAPTKPSPAAMASSQPSR